MGVAALVCPGWLRLFVQSGRGLLSRIGMATLVQDGRGCSCLFRVGVACLSRVGIAALVQDGCGCSSSSRVGMACSSRVGVACCPRWAWLICF